MNEIQLSTYIQCIFCSSVKCFKFSEYFNDFPFLLCRAKRKGDSIIQSPKETKQKSTKSLGYEKQKSIGSHGKVELNDIKPGYSLNDDLETCVETETGTDLGTDFVNVFFQKKQELKEKQEMKEKEIRKSLVSHAFPVVNDSDDDFTVVTALKSSRTKLEEPVPIQVKLSGKFVEHEKSDGPSHNRINKLIEQSTSDDDDSGGEFNVFRKSRQKSRAEAEEDIFNEEFEVKKSLDVDVEAEITSRGAKSFFEEIDAKYKSSTKESTSFQDQTQQMVKACPECGEVNKVYVTWCVECGGVLSEVKPVPFMPKKSHTPREVAEKVNRPNPSAIPSTAAQESFKIKLENSFNGPNHLKKRQMSNGRSSEDQESTGTGNIRESDDFEYEQMESPVRTLPETLKRVLSLDLRTSTDSSAVASSSASGVLSVQGAAGGKTPESIKNTKKSGRKGVHNELVRMSEKIDFVYNEAESPKKSYPHGLQKELSLELSVDSDSTTMNRINDAGKIMFILFLSKEKKIYLYTWILFLLNRK